MATHPTTLNVQALKKLLPDETALLELLRLSATVNDGLIAQLHAAVDGRLWPEAAELAHKLKGAFANLGADELSDLCARLETVIKSQEYLAAQELGREIDDANKRLALEVGAFEHALSLKTGTAPPLPVAGKSKRIVFVDDHPANSAIYQRVTDQVGGAVAQCFTEPAVALDWCREQSADLLVVDYKMPNMDGLEFVRALKNLPGWHDVPVLMLTAVHDPQMHLEAQAAGVLGVLTKPFDKAQFLHYVGNVLERAGR